MTEASLSDVVLLEDMLQIFEARIPASTTVREPGVDCVASARRKAWTSTCRRACRTQRNGISQHQQINHFAEDLLVSLGSNALCPAGTNVSEEGVPTRTLVDERTPTVAWEKLINPFRRKLALCRINPPAVASETKSRLLGRMVAQKLRLAVFVTPNFNSWCCWRSASR